MDEFSKLFSGDDETEEEPEPNNEDIEKELDELEKEEFYSADESSDEF